MKEIPLSLCERTSLIDNLKSGIRLDGREFLEMRAIEINFGKDFGSCTVLLGETRVLAQVTCEVVEPRPSRPNEGKLSIAVHLSPMAAPHFEQGRGNDITDELQMILDRNIKESHCLDVESLCIMAEESVWQLKVDVTILNYGGNIGDACNIAAVAALRHFHRPDVTVEEDGRVTIHTSEEREFIPTFLKKIPICLTYALFVVDSDVMTLLDPTEKEERVMSGKFTVGLNPHGEITSLLFPGKLCLKMKHILDCVSKTFLRSKSLAEKVMKLVEEDLETRKSSIRVEGYLKKLKSDSEYNRNLLMERVKGITKMELETPNVPNKMESEDYDDDRNQKSSEDVHSETVEVDKMDVEESSDEEFSAELLAKSLTEIKKEKKEKAKKNKSNKSS